MNVFEKILKMYFTVHSPDKVQKKGEMKWYKLQLTLNQSNL